MSGAEGGSENPITVGIVVFDQVEVLDFCGPFEVFSVTRRDEERPRSASCPYAVRLISEDGGTVVTAGGMRVLSHTSFDACPRVDVLVVPGGRGTRTQLDNDVMLRFLSTRSLVADLTTSVCTGSLLLGRTGLLDGRRATTHWRSLDLLQEMCPEVRVDRDHHVVVDGDVITSAGISAGIDMALTVVARQLGEETARATARQMEYPYPETNHRRIAI